MTPAEILRNGAEAIRRDGWIQGRRHMVSLNPNDEDDHYYGTGPMCALGGMERAIGCPWHLEGAGMAAVEAVQALAALLPQDGGFYPITSIAAWNNAPGQTAENVAAAMELAAILFEEHEHAALVPDPVPVTASALGGEG